MQVVVRQISGLGNQLFQYSAGVYFARRFGAELRLIVDRVEDAHSYGSPRPFLLGNFTIPHVMQAEGTWDRVVMPRREALERPSRVLRLLCGVQVIRESLQQRYTFVEDLPKRFGVRSLYVSGYWQAHQYSTAVEPELREYLQFRQAPDTRNREALGVISECVNPISLHMRRGDYTLAAEGNIALPFDYYQEAIARLRQRFPNPTFIVFSDDIAYARQRMPSDVKTVFVDHNGDFASQEDLRLMAACRHHIIANSSFSWWGAWLNPRNDKTVIAPKRWKLTEDSYFPDLLPSKWEAS